MADKKLKMILETAFESKALLNNLKVSLFVGIILNIINQGREIISFDLSSINYPKFILTFLVPFLVSLYASTFTKMKFLSGDISPVHAKLICAKCNEAILEVNKGEKIKECVNCKEKTKWKILV